MAALSSRITGDWRMSIRMNGQAKERCWAPPSFPMRKERRWDVPPEPWHHSPGPSLRCHSVRGSGSGLEASDSSGENLGVLPQADDLGEWERGEESWQGAVVFQRSSGRRQRLVTSLERLGLAKLASSRTQQLAGQQQEAAEGETAVVIDMEVQRSGMDLKLSGVAGTAVALRCRRCFCPVAQWIGAEYALTLTPNPIQEPTQHSLGVVVGRGGGGGDEEVQEMDLDYDDKLQFPGESTSMDLSKYFRDALHLEVPFGIICESSCKGVCESCGQNWNEGSCSCARKPLDNRWSALEQLRAQLQGNAPES